METENERVVIRGWRCVCGGDGYTLLFVHEMLRVGHAFCCLI